MLKKIIAWPMRHRVLQWARIFAFVYFFVLFLGSTSGLMLIGWRTTNIIKSMSSGKVQNVGERSVLCLSNLAQCTVC